MRLGGGLSFQPIDRETVRISHTYIALTIGDKSFYGNKNIGPLNDPVIRSMASIYSRYRFRAFAVSWIPVKSNTTPGVMAMACTTATAVNDFPTIENIGAMPGASITSIYEGGRTTCDMRAYMDEWYVLEGGAGRVIGSPRLLWTTVDKYGGDMYGYFAVSVSIEFTAPIFNPTKTTKEAVLTIEDKMAELQMQLDDMKIAAARETTSDAEDESKSDGHGTLGDYS